MPFPRLPWLIGTLSCLVLSARLVKQPPIEEPDREVAALVARVQREVRGQYVDEPSPDRLRQMQQAAVNGMLSVLDPHTEYVPPAQRGQFMEILNGNFQGVGIVMMRNDKNEISVRTPIAGGPAFAAGIEAGDVITHVDGEPATGSDFEALRQRVRGAPGTSVRLTVRHYDCTTTDVNVRREQIARPTVTGYAHNVDGSWDWIADRDAMIGYVRIAQFNEQTGGDVHAAIEAIVAAGGRGVVLDVRFNPGGLLDEAGRIADLFLDEGVIDSVRGHARPESITYAKPADTLFYGPMAILINGDSASASEILAGALADHRRAAVVGTRSYGKGSVQEVEDWADGGSLKLTVARWYPPSGINVNREPGATTWGIAPTIEVKLSDAETADLDQALAEGEPIPPKSHATTRPARFADRQLEVAVKAVKTQIGLGKESSASKPSS